MVLFQIVLFGPGVTSEAMPAEETWKPPGLRCRRRCRP